MLPKSLIAEYWGDVLKVLTSTHRLSTEDASAAMRAYRELIDSKGIGDLTYHRDAESVAQTVAVGWESGFLKRPAAARTP